MNLADQMRIDGMRDIITFNVKFYKELSRRGESDRDKHFAGKAEAYESALEMLDTFFPVEHDVDCECETCEEAAYDRSLDRDTYEPVIMDEHDPRL